jgi:signal transduction histidine kinase
VLAHGGTIAVKSAIGVTIFTIELPKTTDQPVHGTRS